MGNAEGNHGQVSSSCNYTVWSARKRGAMVAASYPASPDADQDPFWAHAVSCVTPLYSPSPAGGPALTLSSSSAMAAFRLSSLMPVTVRMTSLWWKMQKVGVTRMDISIISFCIKRRIHSDHAQSAMHNSKDAWPQSSDCTCHHAQFTADAWLLDGRAA